MFNHSIFFYFGLRALTRVDQDLAATETFYRLAKYESVKSDALQLSAADVETGANVQLPNSACLYVEQQTLSPTFVFQQLMFWFHQPQRKIDVLTLSGAGEIPCPTNVLRCCMDAAAEQQRHQDLLAWISTPSSCRHMHKYATCTSKAFIGCAALCRSMKELHNCSLPPTPLRQVSCSDDSASETKSKTQASSRGASAAPKRQQPPATSASAAQSRRKRIVESSSESES